MNENQKSNIDRNDEKIKLIHCVKWQRERKKNKEELDNDNESFDYR